MAKGVPGSFRDLKSRTAEKLRKGENDVPEDVVEMGNSMLNAGVEPKSPQDRVAKRMWKNSGPREKEALAGMVTRMAKDDNEKS
ncbi:MAG: DUF3243 domain-containing protein [Firmicutes bacterium]|uniref:DUF3243 domain-containing protein n=1 Tax=Sulfobacillus benefaciens TaxID=453960 RepID=A0A2T2WX41_9FIRM|nr:DUF3243 domain-containing protein [Bacillota bacterium]MCL5014034.1 DUF3243 domain-containing protein [Bacillota bacterium]PSR26804.1 MAG: hypothetical protein C7B43_12975 [Sulfobacillus benefaciens]HBQ95616.1 hypothetical protein [Sulfobacillus sp.]